MRAQCLANFIAKLTTTTKTKLLWWKLYVNGSSNEKSSEAGVILESSDEEILEQSLRFEFEIMNNQAKYEALLVYLILEKEVGAKHLKFWSDSKLVTSKLNGDNKLQILKWKDTITWLPDLKRFSPSLSFDTS